MNNYNTKNIDASGVEKVRTRLDQVNKQKKTLESFGVLFFIIPTSFLLLAYFIEPEVAGGLLYFFISMLPVIFAILIVFFILNWFLSKQQKKNAVILGEKVQGNLSQKVSFIGLFIVVVITIFVYFSVYLYTL